MPRGIGVPTSGTMIYTELRKPKIKQCDICKHHDGRFCSKFKIILVERHDNCKGFEPKPRKQLARVI
jgi:hypothetical protein